MRPGQRPPERRRSSVIGYNRTAKVVIIFHLSKHSPIIFLKLYRWCDTVGPARLGLTIPAKNRNRKPDFAN